MDYVREINQLVHGKSYRVTEHERKIFDTLKIITEAGWLINGTDEFKLILKEIGIVERNSYETEGRGIIKGNLSNAFVVIDTIATAQEQNQVNDFLRKTFELLGFNYETSSD